MSSFKVTDHEFRPSQVDGQCAICGWSRRAHKSMGEVRIQKIEMRLWQMADAGRELLDLLREGKIDAAHVKTHELDRRVSEIRAEIEGVAG